METLLGKHWHSLPSSDVARFLESDTASGRDRFEVRRRQMHFGDEKRKNSPAKEYSRSSERQTVSE